MKSFTKKITVLFALLAAALGMAIFAACGESGPDPDAFTVTVVDENDQPFTGVRVQLCEFDEETGELGICYPGVEVDENGKAVYKNPEAKSRMEVHIQDIDNYMYYDKVAMNRGEAVTVKVTEHKPLGGDGTGVHYTEKITDNEGNVLEERELPNFASFNPYIVEEGYYRVNVAAKDKIVYFAFRTAQTGKYSVQSSGSVDPRVYELYGTLSTGFQDYGEETEGNQILNGNRNRTANSKNFYYEFEVDQARINQSQISGAFGGVTGWNGTRGVAAFGITVEDEESAGKDFCIEFKYKEPLESSGGEVHEVIKATQLLGAGSDLVYLTDATLPGQGNGYWDDDGTYHPGAPGEDTGTKKVYRFKESGTNTAVLKSILAWNEYNAEYILDTTTNIYHLKNADGSKGPMLVAYINPTGGHGAWDLSFYDIAVTLGNQFAYYSEDGLTRYSYTDTDENGESFIGSYGLACNSDGVYPLTAELKDFLDWFTTQSSYFKQLIPNPTSIGLTTGKYFLYFCGYYRDGSQKNPYALTAREDNTVAVQEDGTYGTVTLPHPGTATKNYTVTITGAAGLTVTYKDTPHSDTSGTVSFVIEFTSTDWSQGVVLLFTGFTGKITVSITEATT